MKVGDKVIYYTWCAGPFIGVIQKLGKTATIGSSFEDKFPATRIRFESIYPATPENLARVARLKAIDNERINILVEIRAGGTLK